MQFTLKNPVAVHRAFEQMKERGKVELIWGPLRHGAGHNIVFYFRDYTGRSSSIRQRKRSSSMMSPMCRACGRPPIRVRLMKEVFTLPELP